MNHTQLERLDQYYTVGEVARLLNVHEMTVRDWYWKGNLKIQRVGRKGVRIATWDLKRFLAQLNEDRVARVIIDDPVTRLSHPDSQENTIAYEQRKDGLSRET
jgi:excisionase family DNA binding protein